MGVTSTVRVEMPTHWQLAEVTEVIFKCRQISRNRMIVCSVGSLCLPHPPFLL